jgi:Protein of unknown function (DUF3052)
MSERDYSHRDVLDKLGIKQGHKLAFDETDSNIPSTLKERVLARDVETYVDGDGIDVVLVAISASADPVEVLERWKPLIKPNGGIWLLTPKRGQPGYVDQNVLIEAGKLAGLVDNKVCSIDDQMSAMRFVIRKSDRK